MGFLKDIRNLEEQAEASRSRRSVHGRPAAATIHAVRDTGGPVDDDPTVELELSVVLEGEAPYVVTHRETLSRVAMAGLRPGATIPVRVDPDDRMSLMLG
ncbi:MAG: hypothetical protein QOK49_1218 [Baekduia sp.]|jgi:hypothetical protein|nr:hypothetical protein [Baekduia sp.]